MKTLTEQQYVNILSTDFLTFIRRSFLELHPHTPFIPAKYLHVLADYLEKCRRGEITRLIICLPPRSLKSLCVSTAFAAWLQGHNPATQIICASYGQELANKFGRDTKTLMTSSWYKHIFPNTRLAADKTAVHDFSTTMQGYRMATSVGGTLTGRGGDFLIIDDPIKPDEALSSETERENAIDWFKHVAMSRLNDKSKGCVIVVMQRLHMDDLAGYLLEQGGWTLLSFPAIAEQDERHEYKNLSGKHVYQRRKGEVLHPERDTLEAYETIRKNQGEYVFNSQYQQNPTPLGGNMVKTDWLRYYEPGEEPAKYDYVIQSWDTANKTGELNDFSACVTLGWKNKHIYVLDVFRRRMEFPHLKRAVYEQAAKHRPTVILIEDKASGTSLIQELIAEGMHAVQACEPPPGQDKPMRLYGHTAVIENGFFLLPKEAPWLADYVNELTSFPGGRYDDQVDATTQALGWIKKEQSSSWGKWKQIMERNKEEFANPEGRKVRLIAPPGITRVRTPTHREVSVEYDGTFEVSEEDAGYMIGRPYKKAPYRPKPSN